VGCWVEVVAVYGFAKLKWKAKEGEMLRRCARHCKAGLESVGGFMA
jgi:hypothetical protein